ncbi:MAG: outer membrane protein assembly factor BamC [Gammaproteobacteria bacterium]|nr:outer membrane protein assembly factor BamC [Gammaproteobacteria bacterium]
MKNLAFLKLGKHPVLWVLIVVLSACSSTELPSYKGVYEAQKERQRPLEVPPDLVLPQGDRALSLPSIVAEQASLVSYQDKDKDKDKVYISDLLPDPQGARLQRDGGIRWLELDVRAEKIWPKLKAFYESLGFKIIKEDLLIGYLETDWQENRVEFPSSWFGKLLSSIDGASIKDKYRVRLERIGGNGEQTLMFITHQGLKASKVEVQTSEENTWYWEYRDADPELETEMMMRFLVYTGMSQKQAGQIVKTDEQPRAILVETEEQDYLKVNESFPRTWRRVGLALDRLGLPVEDRNRSAGVYYFTLSSEFRKREDQGWFTNLFGGSSGEISNTLLLKLDDEGEYSKVFVRGRKGARVDEKLVKLILKELHQYLR